jgi:hypothetical protein
MKNAKKLIAAAAVFAAAGSAFAADAPAAVAAPVAAGATVLGANQATAGTSAGRADVRAEAVEFVKNYKTTFAVQLEQYKN